MTPYFDIHNHLFNKNFLAKELRYRLIKELKNHLGIAEEHSRGPETTSRGIENMTRLLKRYTHAIRIFCRKNSEAIYQELDKTYKGEFILTPLTFDLTWCFAPSADRGLAREPEIPVEKQFDREMEGLLGDLERGGRLFSASRSVPLNPKEERKQEKFRVEKERFLTQLRKLEEAESRGIRGSRTRRSGTPGTFSGWEEQIRQIAALKNNPAYQNKVFPFLAVDPRRPGIESYARENVGKGKLFAGVKLYCPNGYSPTDPLLYGPDGKKGGLYAFCEEKGIPVTTHNSLGGFATFARSVLVRGDIHRNGELIHFENEEVHFSQSFLGKDAVVERAETLNHPLLWRKVVEKYPNLILNLAHFGGGKALGNALDNPCDPSLWSNRIIELLMEKRFRVYTDVSCFTELDVIKKLKTCPIYQEIRHKVLFGSDYTLLLLFEDNFNANIRQFREIFGSDFEIIAGTNPREFLKMVI